MVLVNAHTHLELSALSHLLPAGDAPFAAWLTKAGKSVRGRDAGYFLDACESGIQKLLDAGTTHVGDVSWSGASVQPLARSGLRGLVWLEMRGVVRRHGEERFEWLKREVDCLRRAASGSPIQVGIEMHAPYSVHPELWEPVLRWIDDQQLPLCIHAAESPSEWELFRRARGDLLEFEKMMAMSRLPGWLRYPAAKVAVVTDRWTRPAKRTLPSPHGTTPVAYLDRIGALQFRPLLVHMVHVSDDDIRRVQRCGSTVVHCPRSNLRLRCGRMPLEKYLAARIPVLLGTDSLASSPSLDVQDEITAAKQIHADLVEPARVEALARDTAAFDCLTSGANSNATPTGSANRQYATYR